MAPNHVHLFYLFCAFSPLVHWTLYTQTHNKIPHFKLIQYFVLCATWRFCRELLLFDVWTYNAYTQYTHIKIAHFRLNIGCRSQHSFWNSSEQILILTMAKMKSAFFRAFFYFNSNSFTNPEFKWMLVRTYIWYVSDGNQNEFKITPRNAHNNYVSMCLLSWILCTWLMVNGEWHMDLASHTCFIESSSGCRNGCKLV